MENQNCNAAMYRDKYFAIISLLKVVKREQESEKTNLYQGCYEKKDI